MRDRLDTFDYVLGIYKMKMKMCFLTLMSTVLLATLSGCVATQTTAQTVPNRWQTLASANEAGLLDSRVDLWRNGRLWHVIEDGYLLSGYESKPGTHAWQGEHVGKWLHAATLAHEETGDEKETDHNI